MGTEKDLPVEPLLEGLTPAQREAVEHFEGPLLVLAGPGSGKTRVITHRIAYLIARGVPPAHILALTFTNKAAEEMRCRVVQLIGDAEVWIGTFHRFAAQLLRRYGGMVGLQPNFTIYDTEQSHSVIRRVLSESGLRDPHLSTEAVASAISWAKNHLLLPEQYAQCSHHPLAITMADLYRRYQQTLLRSNAVDFDDLLFHVVNLLRENPELRAALDAQYRFILVDEYQDTNLAQYAIARALSIDYPNLTVTGDPDQSIYGWRGANLRNILEFEKDFSDVRVIRLEQNYRSTKRILRVAAQLITHNVKRKQKELFTENGEGRPVRLTTYATGQQEAEAIAAHIAEQIRSGKRRPRDFAIFYRLNALSRQFEVAFRQQGIPYQLVNSVEFFQRKEIRDVLAYLQLLNNPQDDLALMRAINSPPRGIGKRTLEQLGRYAEQEGLSLLEAVRRCEKLPSLSSRAKKALREFLNCYQELEQLVFSPVEEILGNVMELSGYRAALESSDDPSDQERLANLEELLTVARQFDERGPQDGGLEAFLEEISLVSETDRWDSTSDRVALMTLHASKGLEFPVVFLVAIEQGILPHERSRNDHDALEEERRLMFVGITRAQEELYLSHAEYRDFRGRRRLTVPSQFLMELPRSEMEIVYAGQALRGNEADACKTTFAGVDGDSPQQFGFADEAVVADSGPAAIHYSSDEFNQDTYSSDESIYCQIEDFAEQSEPTSGKRPGQSRSYNLRLTTAAELAGQASTPISPDAFYQGQLVVHAEYGIGKIIALSGSGQARTATVVFPADKRKLKVRLEEGKLRPLTNANSS